MFLVSHVLGGTWHMNTAKHASQNNNCVFCDKFLLIFFLKKKNELIFLYYVNWNIKYRRVYLFSFHVECIRYIFTIIQLHSTTFLHILKKQFSCYANLFFFYQRMSNSSRQLRNKTKTVFLCIIPKTNYICDMSIHHHLLSQKSISHFLYY